MNQTTMLESLIEVLKKQMAIIEQQANDLKCCGNCLHGSDSCHQVKEQELSAFNCCEHWEFDVLTAEERIK